MDMTERHKLVESFKRNVNLRTFKEILKADESTELNKLRRQAELKDYRHTQGRLSYIEEVLELLTKAIS